MSEAKAIVQEFCDLMVRRDADALRPFLTHDALYQNVGMEPTIGVEEIVTNLAGQFQMFPDSYEYVMKNIAANGDVVLTERLDLIRTPSGIQGVPVMGTFVLRDGKICRWHDYWDTGLPRKMMMGESVSTLIPTEY
jgi:limonene-1,2-epoxide hydrolase